MNSSHYTLLHLRSPSHWHFKQYDKYREIYFAMKNKKLSRMKFPEWKLILFLWELGIDFLKYHLRLNIQKSQENSKALQRLPFMTLIDFSRKNYFGRTELIFLITFGELFFNLNVSRHDSLRKEKFPAKTFSLLNRPSTLHQKWFSTGTSKKLERKVQEFAII